LQLNLKEIVKRRGVKIMFRQSSGFLGKIQAPKNSKSSVLKSELQDTLDIVKGKILQTLQKQIANV
jgi:hypothetical protein